jgi:hypothetical protein
MQVAVSGVGQISAEVALGASDGGHQVQSVDCYAFAGAENQCTGIRDTFNTAYGNCESYKKGDPNHNYCGEDLDSSQGLHAEEVCSECDKCSDEEFGIDASVS